MILITNHDTIKDVAVVDGHLESETSVASSYELPTRVAAADNCKGNWHNAIPNGEEWMLVESRYSRWGCGVRLGTSWCALCISRNNPLAHSGRCGYSWTEAYNDCGKRVCRTDRDCGTGWGRQLGKCQLGIPSGVCSHSEAGESEKSMMAAQIADNKVNVALGFFAVIGGCAIMYNAVQRVRKYACEQQWTPIGEEDV